MRVISPLLLSLTCGAASALAQTPPDYGFPFVTIGSAGNAAYNPPHSPTEDLAAGRGSVPYDYRISKLEITTGQWMEFVNDFANIAGSPINNSGPTYWGAGATGGGSGHWTYSLNGLPGAAMLPVGGISWRDAARYCNWLTNNKTISLAAISTGAYDTSTFGQNPDGTISDAPSHLPGAKFWIPTLDEWLKASFYDPNGNGAGQARWWTYMNGTDAPGISGLPGVGTTSAGIGTPQNPSAAWFIPLGAYSNEVSPWGLWDTSGGGSEWTEELLSQGFPRERAYGGPSAIYSEGSLSQLEFISGIRSHSPNPIWSNMSFRIASAVPTPSIATVLCTIGCGAFLRRRRSL